MPWLLGRTGGREGGEVERKALSIVKDEWEERGKIGAGDGRRRETQASWG